MFQRKPRRFRRRQNGRNHHASRGDDNLQNKLRLNSFSNNQPRNSFRTYQSAEKLFEKYNSLAKEAMTSGDKTLAENYLQHADHFMRIIDNKNSNQNQNKIQVNEGAKLNDGSASESSETIQNQSTEENKNKNSE